MTGFTFRLNGTGAGARRLGAACSLLLMTTPAPAHPHVWVTMKEELVYAPDGALVAIRHAWTFDETYSAFATQGLKSKVRGRFTREELQTLAQTNIESLKEYRYFTYIRIEGRKQKDAFEEPVDYWLDYEPKKTELTLHLTMPLRTPIVAKQLMIEVYDPEFFVDFGLADGNPVNLAGASSHCSVATEKPYASNYQSTPKLDQLFTTSEANVGMGISFANKISVQCP